MRNLLSPNIADASAQPGWGLEPRDFNASLPAHRFDIEAYMQLFWVEPKDGVDAAAATALEHAQMFHARKAFFRDTVTVPLLAFEEVQVPDTYRSRFKQHVQRIVETGEIVPLQPWKQ